MYSPETEHSINGVPGRLYARHVRPDKPELFSAQKWVSEKRRHNGEGYRQPSNIQVEIRFDDKCKNGHATFAMTATIWERGIWAGGGCCHDDIAAAFPELAPLIKWHLCSTDGPMHYVANTVYHAGDRDHNGLRKGESRQVRNGRTGELAWTLEAINAPGVRISSTETGQKYRDAATVPLFILEKSVDCDAACLPPAPALQWVPMLRIGEGKPRDLHAARSAAIWPDASDAELMADKPELTTALEARLPALMAEFRRDMEAAGLLWAPIAV